MSQFWSQTSPLMLAQGVKVLRRLIESGYTAYFVGGCVRDELMQRPVHDMDIATSASPEQVIQIFERTVPTGLQHGTVTVLMDSIPFEVTTYRKETKYVDHRRPEDVEFVNEIEEDLQRRDFTMNAIAQDMEGRLIDPFGGQEDIHRQLIRCVGRAEERFSEDALRMMRAVRFASVFGFRPVKSLWRALLAQKGDISYIAVERLRAELTRVILGPNPLRGLALLGRSGLLDAAKAPIPKRSPDSLQLASIEYLPEDPPELRWSVLLQSLGVSGEESTGFLKQWTFPNQLSECISSLIKFDERIMEAIEHTFKGKSVHSISAAEEEILRRAWVSEQISIGREAAESWIGRQQVILSSRKEKDEDGYLPSRLLELAKGWFDDIQVNDLKDLAVTGGDVVTLLGRQGGPWLGALMKELLHLVAAGDLQNDKEAILRAVKDRDVLGKIQ